MAKRLHLPLFPLNSVLFPGGVLPLRIFEPRYMEMVSVCMKEQSGFGVSLILSGKEVGEAATTYEVGTLVNIIDWDQRDDGLLGITVQGQQRFRIHATNVRSSQLVMAEVELLDEAAALPNCCPAASRKNSISCRWMIRSSASRACATCGIACRAKSSSALSVMPNGREEQ